MIFLRITFKSSRAVSSRASPFSSTHAKRSSLPLSLWQLNTEVSCEGSNHWTKFQPRNLLIIRFYKKFNFEMAKLRCRVVSRSKPPPNTPSSTIILTNYLKNVAPSFPDLSTTWSTRTLALRMLPWISVSPRTMHHLLRTTKHCLQTQISRSYQSIHLEVDPTCSQSSLVRAAIL